MKDESALKSLLSIFESLSPSVCDSSLSLFNLKGMSNEEKKEKKLFLPYDCHFCFEILRCSKNFKKVK